MTGLIPIVHFTIERTWIQPGDSVCLHWHVDGVKTVYFHPEELSWQDYEVASTGEQHVSPTRSTTYCLRVVRNDESVEIHRRVVMVHKHAAIQDFSVDRPQVPPGEVVTFFWRAEGVESAWFYPEGEPWLEHAVAPVGQQEVWIGQTSTYCLRVVKKDCSQEIQYLTILVPEENT